VLTVDDQVAQIIEGFCLRQADLGPQIVGSGSVAIIKE
jgi:hypothetical protein